MTTYKSIVISSGHGLKIRGAAGSPSGSPSDPYLDEVDEARKVVDALAEALEDRGVSVVVFHDDTSTNQDTNLKTIVSNHNKHTRELDISCHFNAYEQGSKCMGTEMLYVTQGALADELSHNVAVAGDFIDRGPKKNTGLYFLNNTDMPSVLMEICFCDSSCDTDKYRENFDAIIDAMATVLGGEGVARPPEPIPPFERPGRPPGRPPPDVPVAEHPTLGKGDTGPDVVALQKSLGLLGDNADGDFGSTTETQVKAFQKAVGITSDGVVGPTTWEYIDELDRRMAQGESGLPKGLSAEVIALAESSSLMDYAWPGRSVAPPGYIPGMALCYALAVVKLEQGNSAAMVMAEAAGDEDEDALAWYENELEDINLDVSDDGLETMRALFTLLIGLGMRESSGKYCEGRDMSADNVAADTCEAGLFQMSANMHTASPEMKKLFDVYWKDPQGFLDVFREGISPTSSNLDVYGSGKGASFQWLGKFSPAFAVFTTAVGLRKRKAHWGPIQRKEVTLSPAARDLLKKIEALVAAAV